MRRAGRRARIKLQAKAPKLPAKKSLDRPRRTTPIGPKDRLRRLRTLHRLQDGICAICLAPMIHPDIAKAERFRDAAPGRPIVPAPHHPTIEHVVLRCNGGSNALPNLLATHSDCNNRRGAGPLPPCALEMHARVLAALRRELPPANSEVP